MKRSEAPPFPPKVQQSFEVTSEPGRFYMHPQRLAWVVPVAANVRVLYHLATV